jgi:hypothetical protein
MCNNEQGSDTEATIRNRFHILFIEAKLRREPVKKSQSRKNVKSNTANINQLSSSHPPKLG